MVSASKNPVSAGQMLSAVFDKGLSMGIGTLTRIERQWFLIQDFIIETEMGGLSGYLNNRLIHRGRLSATATAMETHDVRLLIPISRELQRRFLGHRSRPGETWDDLRSRHVSDARLAKLEERVDQARSKGYGLDKSKLAVLVARPRWASVTRKWLDSL